MKLNQIAKTLITSGAQANGMSSLRWLPDSGL